MRISVDVGDLVELADAVGVIHRQLDAGTTTLAVAARAVPAGSTAGPPVQLAADARAAALDGLAALRAVVAVVADAYAATEARVAALFAGCPAAAVRRLLTATDHGRAERLLVTAPALAAAFVSGEAEPGTDQALVDELRRTLLLPARGAAVAQARILAAMAEGARRMFALAHPRLMTSLAAAPTSDRFAASRVLLAADLGALLQVRATVGPGHRRDRLDARIALRQGLLRDQVVLRHPDGSTTRHPHQLLSFDPAGDGRIVEVIGDLRRAAHVSVFVPGTGSDLERFGHSFDRMKPFAAADPSLAVVVWQNADHPDQPFDDPLVPPATSAAADLPHLLQAYAREHVAAAAFRDSADVAGPALAADVEGLRVAEPAAAADLTVLGHSYGGSIVGSAEAHGMVVDRVVHVASAGAYVGTVRDYADGRTRRFSMTAYDDPIRLAQGHSAADATPRLKAMLPTVLDPLAPVVADATGWLLGGRDQLGHGLDPDLMPGVVRLDTGVHADGSLVRGHSGMFEPGGTAWRNLLAVMTRAEVAVLQPQLWSSHLDPLGVAVTQPGGAAMGGTTVHPLPPRYVVDHTPYADPAYRPPMLDLG